MRTERIFLLLLLVLQLSTGCDFRTSKTQQLPPFSVTNAIVGGRATEIIEATNGLSLYFTETNVVVWFREDSCISVDYNRTDRLPTSLMFRVPNTKLSPAADILDINADGVPEMRERTDGGKREIFFDGEWYAKGKKGTNSMITIGGEEILVRFDGRRWVRILSGLKI